MLAFSVMHGVFEDRLGALAVGREVAQDIADLARPDDIDETPVNAKDPKPQ